MHPSDNLIRVEISGKSFSFTKAWGILLQGYIEELQGILQKLEEKESGEPSSTVLKQHLHTKFIVQQKKEKVFKKFEEFIEKRKKEAQKGSTSKPKRIVPSTIFLKMLGPLKKIKSLEELSDQQIALQERLKEQIKILKEKMGTPQRAEPRQEQGAQVRESKETKEKEEHFKLPSIRSAAKPDELDLEERRASRPSSSQSSGTRGQSRTPSPISMRPSPSVSESDLASRTPSPADQGSAVASRTPSPAGEGFAPASRTPSPAGAVGEKPPGEKAKNGPKDKVGSGSHRRRSRK